MDILEEIKHLHSLGNINFHKLGKDMEIGIRITKVCNERCIFCSTDLDNRVIEYKLLVQIILFLIKSYGNKYNLSFSFSGGEPTLYINLEKIIFLVVKKGFHVKLETNAVNFSNKELLDKFKKFKGKIFFFVSLHGHKKDIYKNITNMDFYNKAVLGIKNLCGNFGNKYVEINCVINNKNFPYLEDYLKFIDDNFYFDNRVLLTFSVMLANKKNYDKYLVKYCKIVDFFNKLNSFNFNNVQLIIEAGGYCQLPFCIFTKINFVNSGKILEYASMLDKNVGSNIMSKSKKCLSCKLGNYCAGLSKGYYNKYGDEELICIL